MKLNLLLVVLLCSLIAQAQNFTNGTVYNYDVGDTIVTGYRT